MVSALEALFARRCVCPWLSARRSPSGRGRVGVLDHCGQHRAVDVDRVERSRAQRRTAAVSGVPGGSGGARRARRPKVSKSAANPQLRAEVIERLDTRWSPQQIACALRVDFPDDPSMWVSHEAIYQALFVPARAVFPAGTHRSLRTGRSRRRSRRGRQRERRGKNPHMVMICDRPAEVDDRRIGGHWEGDLIMGRGHRRAIGTLVERSSRFLILLDLIDGFSADALNTALEATLGSLPSGLRRTLTWDQGTEMSGHRELTASTGLPVYFCDPRSPWQRGTNENTVSLSWVGSVGFSARLEPAARGDSREY